MVKARARNDKLKI